MLTTEGSLLPLRRVPDDSLDSVVIPVTGGNMDREKYCHKDRVVVASVMSGVGLTAPSTRLVKREREKKRTCSTPNNGALQ